MIVILGLFNVCKFNTILAFAGYIASEETHIEEVQWYKKECNGVSCDRT